MEADPSLISTPLTADEPVSIEHALAKQPRIGETIVEALLFVAGAISILTTVGIVYVLASQALNFFTTSGVTVLEFFLRHGVDSGVGQVWRLVSRDRDFDGQYNRHDRSPCRWVWPRRSI